MKRIIYILLLAMGMATVAPLASVVDNRVAAVYAVDAKAKAKAQREKEKAKKAKEREKAKAKAAKEREKAAAQKKKEQARAQAAKQKQRQQAQSQQAKAQPSKAQQAKPASAAVAKSSTGNNLSAAEEKEQYLEQIAAIDKANAKANAYNERDIAHRLGFWGLVGYSNLFTSGINYQAPAAEGLNPTGFKNKDKGFVGGGFGLGYQLRYRQFLMTVGAEFTFYNSVMGIYNQDNGLGSSEVNCIYQTKSGYMLRAVGDNDLLVTSMGVDKGKVRIIGLAIANGLVCLSGCIFAQQQGYFEISMGTGTAVIGLASVIIGTNLKKHCKFINVTTMVIIGAIIYRACVALALKFGMQPALMKLISASILLVILLATRDRKKAS